MLIEASFSMPLISEPSNASQPNFLMSCVPTYTHYLNSRNRRTKERMHVSQSVIKAPYFVHKIIIIVVIIHVYSMQQFTYFVHSTFCSERISHCNVIIVKNELQCIGMYFKYQVPFKVFSITEIFQDTIRPYVRCGNFFSNNLIAQQCLTIVVSVHANMQFNNTFNELIKSIVEPQCLKEKVHYNQYNYHLGTSSKCGIAGEN